MVTAIAVRNVSKRYKLFAHPGDRLKEALHPLRKCYHRDFWALHDICFTVPRGETLGILGRNGSGKSTLLQILTGTMPATSGEVLVQGRIAALLELGAGFDPTLTGRENAQMFGTLNGVPPAEMKRRVPEIEAFADIGEFFDRPVRTYSSGMFARLAFAAALEIDADVLIVDEILEVGDARFQEKCAHRFRELQQRGMTIVFVSHNTDKVLKICRSALLIDHGHLVCQGEAKHVVDAYHRILYRSPAEPGTAVAPGNAAMTVHGGCPAALRAFLASPEPLLATRPYYSKDERRLGDRSAVIVDVLLAADGRFDRPTLSGGEELTFYLKVAYAVDRERPHLGWAVTTREGLHISGSNTLLSDVVLPPARAGDICLYAITIRHHLNSGDYFINLGVTAWEQDWVFLDNRRAVIHLVVQRHGQCTGFVDTPTRFECLDPRNPA